MEMNESQPLTLCEGALQISCILSEKMVFLLYEKTKKHRIRFCC
jgi:hypothetical protein